MPLRLALLTSTAAIAAHLIHRWTRGQPLIVFTPELRIVAGLIGWAILTVPLSYWPGGSIGFLLNSYFKTIAIFWLVSASVSTVTRLRQVAWALSLMAVPLAVSGVREYLSGEFVQGRINGFDAPLTANPNDLALMLNLILPLMVALFTIQSRALVRAGLLAVIFLDAIAVILTFSRGGFLTLATTIVMYTRAWSKRSWGWTFAVLSVLLLGMFLLPSSYLDRLATITEIDADSTGSAQKRWSDLIAGVNFVLQHPIVGAGVGMNVLALHEETGTSWNPVHNVFLEYALELGVPGLVLFLLLFVTCVRSSMSVERRAAGEPARRELFALAEGIRISLIGFGVAALFHPVGYNFVFYYFGGLAIALRTVALVEEGVHGPPASVRPGENPIGPVSLAAR